MPNIRHVLTIDATPESVYQAITTEVGIKNWWTTEANAKAEVGYINEHRFGDKYFNKMKVTKLQSPTHVAWKCVDGDHEWIGTDLSFDIEKGDGNTMLRFAHLNWKEESEFYGFCNHHWGRFLDSMKSYCETGKGTPFVPDEQNN